MHTLNYPSILIAAPAQVRYSSHFREAKRWSAAMSSHDIGAEIERLIKEKQEELKALEATLRIISGSKTTTYTSDDGPQSKDEGTVDLNSLGVAAHADAPTLAERVVGVLRQIPPDQEFTVPHVEALLKKTGFTPGGKSPRARLAMIMGQLEKRGVVTRTAKPKGFKPHRFKLTNRADRNFSLVK